MLGACSSYGESRGTRRVLAWPCNDSHCRARILQAEVTKKLMNLLEDINDWIDMRKALSRDVEKKSIIPLKRPVAPDELECD